MKWEEVKLGNIAEFINGGAWSDKEYTEAGITVVKVTHLTQESSNLILELRVL